MRSTVTSPTGSCAATSSSCERDSDDRTHDPSTADRPRCTASPARRSSGSSRPSRSSRTISTRFGGPADCPGPSSPTATRPPPPTGCSTLRTDSSWWAGSTSTRRGSARPPRDDETRPGGPGGTRARTVARCAAARLPVLCICRGLQLLNVAFGGTMRQHITGSPGVGEHGVPLGGGGATNRYELSPGSLAEAVMGTASPAGRCHHHQAVGEVGEGLVVTGRTADGVVEVMELADAGSWLLAVQWHPEETAATDPANQALFDHLVAAARPQR
ncbi:MAG: gamma-glutamyl-gamma-aminobutyrate hydrolase family protein [Microthrixaceae bacterium]